MHIKTGLGLRQKFQRIRVIGKKKIFCIGRNKTGTTSLAAEMKNLGYIVGHQRTAEMLFDDWVKRDFSRIIKYCRTAQFFQDSPFSLPYTFIVLDQAFPGSKFILTIRNDAEEWYESLIRFHGKKWGNGNIPPTSEDLKNATYIYRGFPYDSSILTYRVPENDPYNKDVLIEHYNTHNQNVRDYFRHRSDDLLTINLKNSSDYGRFCDFLGISQKKSCFPWKNRSQ